MPRSTIASDTTLAPFLSPDFSPVAYLNSTLPSWTPSASDTQTTSLSPAVTSLVDLSAQAQTLIAELDAKLARLSNTLTQLTDDILRSGGRLSYEVEILRADAASLGNALSAGLRTDIAQLVDGVSLLAVDPTNPHSPDTSDAAERKRRPSSPTLTRATSNILHPTSSNVVLAPLPKQKPDYISTLHMLSLVRARLDTVIKTFDAAISWPLPPTALPLRNQLVSVAAPNAMSSINENPDELEAKGKAWEDKVREEVVDLLEDDDGVPAARERVADLRALCTVWKGTVEEKPRVRFVEALERIVEERARE